MALRSAIINVMAMAADKAGKRLIRDFGEVEQLQVSRKGPADFVTSADRKAEKILREALTRARPGYALLMEESGVTQGRDSRHRWIVDPLDGTTNFLHGIPHFCISIALERDGDELRIWLPVEEANWNNEGLETALSDIRSLFNMAHPDLRVRLFLFEDQWEETAVREIQPEAEPESR